MEKSPTDDMIAYEVVQPVAALSHLVESFWLLTNRSDRPKQVIVLPDGRIDVGFSFNGSKELVMLGLESGPSQAEIPAGVSMLTISFRPLALEYFFHDFLPVVPNSATALPADYFGVTIDAFQDLEQFARLLTDRLLQNSLHVDDRKKMLFDQMYAFNGAMTVRELSEKAGWSSRQVNRYFQDILGISLKTYCSILRFRASFGHLKKGQLFPEENYTDQSHFIREIRKYAGVSPKELARNGNDRFIQFSTLKQE